MLLGGSPQDPDGRHHEQNPKRGVKADRTATEPASTATCAVVVVRRGAIGRISVSTMPERCTAALTRSADATMITISSEKPENALS